MDIKSYESQIAELRKKAIEDIENSFIEYIKNDILDCGQVEYLIGEEDWSLFWQDISLECKRLIDRLIFVRDELDINDFNSLMNQCIQIKIATDKEIHEIEEENLDQVLVDMGLSKPKERYLNYIHLSGSEDRRKAIIENLYNRLHHNGLIDPDNNRFNSLFEYSEFEKQKIQWHGTEKQIVGLFSMLLDKRIIPLSYRQNYLKFIELHFLNKNRKPFKSDQLTVVKSNIVNDKIDIISDIIEILVEIK